MFHYLPKPITQTPTQERIKDKEESTLMENNLFFEIADICQRVVKRSKSINRERVVLKTPPLDIEMNVRDAEKFLDFYWKEIKGEKI